MKREDEMGTYYIPEGETRHIRFPQFAMGDGPGRSFWTDDRGTLTAIVEVREADTDRPLLLNQYNADRLIRDLLLDLADRDPGDWVRVSRFEDGGFSVDPEPDAIDGADEAM